MQRLNALTTVVSKPEWLQVERRANVEDVGVTALLQVGDAQFRSEIAEEEYCYSTFAQQYMVDLLVFFRYQDQ